MVFMGIAYSSTKRLTCDSNKPSRSYEADSLSSRFVPCLAPNTLNHLSSTMGRVFDQVSVESR